MVLLGAVWASARMVLVAAGLLGVGLYVSKKTSRRSAQPRRTIRLGDAHHLHVVELDGHRFLVGTGPGAAPSLVRELDSPKMMEGPRETVSRPHPQGTRP
jgi:hypothetical protein